MTVTDSLQFIQNVFLALLFMKLEAYRYTLPNLFLEPTSAEKWLLVSCLRKQQSAPDEVQTRADSNPSITSLTCYVSAMPPLCSGWTVQHWQISTSALYWRAIIKSKKWNIKQNYLLVLYCYRTVVPSHSTPCPHLSPSVDISYIYTMTDEGLMVQENLDQAILLFACGTIFQRCLK